MKAFATATLVGLVLGYLGWVLPIPGGSIVVPSLIVLGIGALIALGGFVLGCFRPRRRELWLFSIVAALLTLAASAWTFEFSLPARLAWDEGPTQQAQAVLAHLERAPGNAPRFCEEVTGWSIGPLKAPYRECALATSEGHIVLFSSTGTYPARGLGYTDVGAAAFPDECSRHLTSQWWMYVSDVSGIGNCPIGYRFHAGG